MVDKASFFSRVFLFSLDPKWKELDQDDDPVDRDCLKGLWALAKYYFIQLFLFRLFGEISAYYKGLVVNIGYDALEFSAQYWQITGTIIGAIAGQWYLRSRRSYKKGREPRFDSIRMTLNWSSLVFALGILMSVVWYACKINLAGEILTSEYLFKFSKFLFGVGWACGIGCAVIWVCEFLPPFLRTSGAIFIGSFGFLGAALSAFGMVWFPPGNLVFFNALLGSAIVAIALLLLLWRSLPDDSKLNLSYQPLQPEADEPATAAPSFGAILWNSLKKRSYLRIVVSCLLIGTSIQFFTFMVRNHNKLSCPKAVEILSSGAEDVQHESNQTSDSPFGKEMGKVDSFTIYRNQSLLRDGCTISTTQGQGAFVSNWWHSEHPDRFIMGAGSWFQFLRYFGMFIAGFFIVRWNLREPILTIKNRHYYLLGSGRFFRKRIPLLAALMAAQFVFMATVLMIWKFNYPIYHNLWFSTLIYLGTGLFGCTWGLSILAVSEQFSLKDRPFWVLLAPNIYRIAEVILMLRSDDSVFWGSDKSMGVMLWGLIFIFIGLISVLNLNESFEGDPLYLRNDDPLSGTEIREEIQKAVHSNASSSDFLLNTNIALAKHFKKIMREQFYCTSIYHLEANKTTTYNIINHKRAFEIYRKAQAFKEGEDQLIGNPYPISSKLIQDGGIYGSFARKIMSDSQIRGGLIWNSGRAYRLGDYKDEKYFVVDLQNIKVADSALLLQNLRNTALRSDEYHNAFGDITYEEISADTFDSPLSKEQEKLLAFYKIDAAQHVSGRYFMHIIKPYTGHPELALMLKTTVALSSARLEELRSLISFVELELKKSQLTAHNQLIESKVAELSREEEHNRKADMGWLLKQHQKLSLEEVKSDPKEYDRIYLSMRHIMNHLSDLAGFNAALLRFEIEKIFRSDYLPETLDLTNLIRGTWSRIVEASKFLRFSKSGHRDKVETFMQNQVPWGIMHDVILKDVYVTPVRIILFELIKNAAEHTAPDKPGVSIQVMDNGPGSGCKIFIANSIDPTDNDVNTEIFNAPFENLPGKAGIKTVKRYLHFFNTHQQQAWHLSAQKTDTHFELSLFIPETCILRHNASK